MLASAKPLHHANFLIYLQDFNTRARAVCVYHFGLSHRFLVRDLQIANLDGSKSWIAWEEPAMMDGNVLVLQPKPAEAKTETHAALVVSVETFSNVNFSADFMTVAQLRAGSRPNAWESSWAVFNYRDDAHFYYVSFKPNGWELGKTDPAYPGGQRFLATGTSRRSPVGVTRRFDIQVIDTTIKVSLDDVHLVSFTDKERPYTSGKIGFYTEDAKVAFDNVRGDLVETFDDYNKRFLSDGDDIGKKWKVIYLGFGTGEIASVNDLSL